MRGAAIISIGTLLATWWAPAMRAQSGAADPASMVSDLLGAACRQNESQFSTFLTADNSKAYNALPQNERAAIVKRFSLSDDPGHPLLSTNAQGINVLRCETPGTTAEFELGTPRVRENLAFVPVTVLHGQSSEFGLVREGGAWKLISLGLVLIDIPQLSKQWATQDLLNREQAAAQTLSTLADAVRKYQRIYGKLPDSLATLGPAPANGVSPEQAQLIDADLATGNHDGYRFRYRIVPASDGSESAFELAATPEQYDKTGKDSFFLDAQGKLHAADKRGAVATADDPELSSASKLGEQSGESSP